EHRVDVDRAESLLRARFTQRGAEAAQRDVAHRALELGLETLELHDAIGEARMLAPEWPAGHGDHAAYFGRTEQRIEREAPGQTARSGQERNAAIPFCHRAPP